MTIWSKDSKKRIYNEEYDKTRKSGETSNSMDELSDLIVPFGGDEEYELRKKARKDARKKNSEDK